MTDTLLLDLSRLGPDAVEFAGEIDNACLDMQAGELIRPFAPLRYSFKAQLFGKDLLVRGNLEQDFDAVCSRCGKDFDFTLKAPDFEVSCEIDPDSEYFDLTNDARECILLTLPAYPVCNEACRGLCPKCRKNLNEGDCGCTDDEADSRWSALDGLVAG